MRSATKPAPQDLTAEARIRDAAIKLFAEHGYNGTAIRAIAAEAGVSPALVVHHYGSKEGLRRACNEHLAETIRIAKTEAVTQAVPDPLELLRTADEAQPLLRYLARMLVDGSPGMAELVDKMVADAVEYSATGIENGVLKPTDQPYARTVVLWIWQLGALALHKHVQRLMGVDLLNSSTAMVDWGAPAVEILTHGVFADDRWEKAIAQAVAQRAREEDSEQEETR